MFLNQKHSQKPVQGRKFLGACPILSFYPGLMGLLIPVLTTIMSLFLVGQAKAF